MYRQLKDDRILETAEKLQKRIAARFPGAGLSEVAGELVQITREAVTRAERIRRPNRWLRGGLVLVGLTAVGILVNHLSTRTDTFFEFLDKTKGAAVYLSAVAVFLFTLEVRYKRRKLIRAVHELRAVAHVIDMHQLTKAPERVGAKEAPLMESGRPMTADEIGRYLHYCTELLSIVGKIGQLYVQDFPDTASQAAVDQFENLTTGLTGKIWQKIMILDRIRADAAEPASPAAPAEAEVRR